MRVVTIVTTVNRFRAQKKSTAATMPMNLPLPVEVNKYSMFPTYNSLHAFTKTPCSDEFRELMTCLTASKFTGPECMTKYKTLLECFRKHGLSDAS